MTIFPTHTCFDDALEMVEYLTMNLGSEAKLDRYRLVHGIAHVPADGKYVGSPQQPGDPFSHAWIERDGNVMMTSGLLGGNRVWVEYDRAEYYAELGIVDFTRYSVREAWEANRTSGHYGPWVERYREHCRKREAVGT